MDLEEMVRTMWICLHGKNGKNGMKHQLQDVKRDLMWIKIIGGAVCVPIIAAVVKILFT
jgi:hypothetical protein